MPTREHELKKLRWFVQLVVLGPFLRTVPGLKTLGTVAGIVLFVLLPLAWLYALWCTLYILFHSFDRESAWWWASVPYSLFFTFLLVVSAVSGGWIGRQFHVIGELFVLVWSIWAVIKFVFSGSTPRTQGDQARLSLGILAAVSWILIVFINEIGSASS